MATSASFKPRVMEDGRERKFEQIIGRSRALESVLHKVERVARTHSTVIIEGETGTGKELIARAIHNMSERLGRPFIKINCSAIPMDLLESELFGHEKGAFTGAIAQKIGRFELADKGTLFLDEVGDLPAALQPKLLRVLQEQEFERLGSGSTHSVDVRVVAATNCNLAEMVAQNKFRSDLYYRLNVFPIVLPPLRERREDIPELVSYFLEKFSRRIGKEITHIPTHTMEAFTSYSWPGNIRELQNLIERAVILADGDTLPNPLSLRDAVTSPAIQPIGEEVKQPRPAAPKSLSEAQRDLIIRTLDATGWVVGGPNGAAERLGLKRTCLIQRIKRLGIERPGVHRGSLSGGSSNGKSERNESASFVRFPFQGFDNL